MSFKENVIRFAHKTGRKINKKSPEIFFVLGTLSLVGTVVTAVVATTKLDEVVEKCKENINDAKEIEVGTELEDKKTGEIIVYTEEAKKRVIALRYVRSGFKLGKLYSLTALMFMMTIGCYGASFGILKKRNAALGASLTAVRAAFDEYRGRVVKELGEEKDDHFMYDTVEETKVVEETDPETGKTKKTKKKFAVPTHAGIYDDFINADHPDWDKNSTGLYSALRAHLLMSNILLRRNGHIYFNRIREEFGWGDTDATEAGIIYDPEKPEEARFLQIKGFGTVREANDGSLYVDDSTINEYWLDTMTGTRPDVLVQFLNIADNIRDDVTRTDGSIKVIRGPKMD